MATGIVRLYLLCFAYHRFRQINDNLIKAFIHLLDQYEQDGKLSAEAAAQQALARHEPKSQRRRQGPEPLRRRLDSRRRTVLRREGEGVLPARPPSASRWWPTTCATSRSIRRPSSGRVMGSCRMLSNEICAISSRTWIFPAGSRTRRCSRRSLFYRACCGRAKRRDRSTHPHFSFRLFQPGYETCTRKSMA
jgi:hypothetical protein